jgi:pseudaminic acid synthase
MKSPESLSIGRHILEQGAPVMIVAELSANHAGSLETALSTLEAAKKAGADAIKLQTYTADTITIKASQPEFRISQGTVWDGRSLHDLYEEAHTPWEWHAALFSKARALGLYCFSSPFDPTAVDFLEQFQPPAYKIASFEITDIPLISYVASKGKPVIISTGIATRTEVQEALEACHQAGNHQVLLLKCTSSYPAKAADANLAMMHDLRESFGVQVGLSDHSEGILLPALAAALGAVMIEKHLILDKSLGGPDAGFSLEPNAFEAMVRAVREAESAMGSGVFDPPPAEIKNRHFSRSLYVVQDVEAGEQITRENVRSIRPGLGLAPKYWYHVEGKVFRKAYPKGTALKMDMFEDGYTRLG